MPDDAIFAGATSCSRFNYVDLWIRRIVDPTRQLLIAWSSLTGHTLPSPLLLNSEHFVTAGVSGQHL